MLKPEHLITLREAVRLGSFSQAANRLGYTASAVSQQITALERELGVQLFERTPRAIIPTESAATVLQHSGAVLAAIDRLVQSADQPVHGDHRIVRLGVFPSLASSALPRLLAELPEPRRRALWIRIAEPSELIPNLGSGGELDLAIVYQVGQSGLSWPSALVRHWLAEDPYCIVYPRCWESRPLPTGQIEDFVNLPWIMNTPGTGDAKVIDGMFARWQLRPKVAGVSDDIHTTMTLVAAGLGAAVLPRLAVIATETSGVEVYAPAWLNISRSVFGLYRPGSTDPALVDLLDRLGSGPLNDD